MHNLIKLHLLKSSSVKANISRYGGMPHSETEIEILNIKANGIKKIKLTKNME